jgi:transposase
MFTCTPATPIFVALDPVDLRASFNGLCAWVQQKLAEDPLSGHLYVFTNRKGNRLKILFWDGDGSLVLHETAREIEIRLASRRGRSPLVAG